MYVTLQWLKLEQAAGCSGNLFKQPAQEACARTVRIPYNESVVIWLIAAECLWTAKTRFVVCWSLQTTDSVSEAGIPNSMTADYVTFLEFDAMRLIEGYFSTQLESMETVGEFSTPLQSAEYGCRMTRYLAQSYLFLRQVGDMVE